jgi:hypothetical protein
MSTTIGDVNINLRMSLAQFKSDVSSGTAAATGDIQGMSDKIGESSNEARGSLALIGEEIGVHIPRHIRGFITGLPGVGTALNAAFTAVAVIALIEVIAKAIEKIQAIREALRQQGEAVEQINASTQALNVRGQAALDELKAKFVGITEGPLAEMEYKLTHVHEQLQALKLGDELQKSFDDLGKKVGSGAFFQIGAGTGLKDFQEFTKQLQTILTTQGRPAALEAVRDELAKISVETRNLQDESEHEGAVSKFVTDNKIASLERYQAALINIRNQIDNNIQASDQERADQEAEYDKKREEAAEKAAEKIEKQHQKELDQLQQLQDASGSLESQNKTALDHQIDQINAVIARWEDYKKTIEGTHKSISANIQSICSSSNASNTRGARKCSK